MGIKAGQVSETDGNQSQLVDMTDNSTTLMTGAGRLIGYYINIVMPAKVVIVKDATTELFTIPASLAVTGNFIPIGGADGLEFETSLIADPEDDAASGQIMFVWQPYQPT